MQHLKILKLSFAFVLIGMVVILIVNYYWNFLEAEKLVKNTEVKHSTSSSSYESTTLNPRYYSYDKKNRKLFVQAEYANKDKKQFNMSKLWGYVVLSNGVKLEYKAEHGEIYTGAKKVILNDGITMSSSNGGKLVTKKLLIDYNKYQFSSDQKITLLYKNIVLTAKRFSFNKDKLIKFSDSVKVKIKANKGI